MPLLWHPDVDPKALEPTFYQGLMRSVHALPFTYTATYGLRSAAVQQGLFNAWEKYSAFLAYDKYTKGQGPVAPYAPPAPVAGLAAPPGFSAHEFALAIDVALDGDDKTPGCQPTWNILLPGWQALFTAVRADPVLHSGADFPPPKQDYDHIERYNWKAFKAWNRPLDPPRAVAT